ncbi:THO complex subunit 2-like isoform X1 [Cydia splendana]|uniref:THO complex subunit 2-like isoform X1 n=2 Tax=Cydia splendana TaxID=1100963 RepID=UPI0028F49D46
MFKFGGWKASLNLSGVSRRREVYDNGPDLSSGGAYRSHREDVFGRNSISEPPKKLTPSMVKLPPSKETIKTSKSASDLKDPNNLPPQLRKSTPDVSTDPKGGPSNNRDSAVLYKNAKQNAKDDKKEKEKKKAEKQRLAEEKKKAQEQAKQDKLKIQRDKKIAEQQAKDVKARKKESKKALPQASVTKSLVPTEPQKNPLGRVATNTLESSISRSSGPPPYTEEASPQGKQINKNDTTGNTSFSKPIENSSWDLISEHRSQINRNPVASGSRQKQMVLDMQLSFDKAQASDRDNSEV